MLLRRWGLMVGKGSSEHELGCRKRGNERVVAVVKGAMGRWLKRGYEAADNAVHADIHREQMSSGGPTRKTRENRRPVSEEHREMPSQWRWQTDAVLVLQGADWCRDKDEGGFIYRRLLPRVKTFDVI